MQNGYISQEEAAFKLGCSEEIVAQLRKQKLLSGILVHKKLILLETSVNILARAKAYLDGTEGAEINETEHPLMKGRERMVISRLLEGATFEQIGEELSVTKERIRQITEKTLAKVADTNYDGTSPIIECLVRENASLRKTILNLQAIIAGYERRYGKE